MSTPYGTKNNQGLHVLSKQLKMDQTKDQTHVLTQNQKYALHNNPIFQLAATKAKHKASKLFTVSQIGETMKLRVQQRVNKIVETKNIFKSDVITNFINSKSESLNIESNDIEAAKAKQQSNEMKLQAEKNSFKNEKLLLQIQLSMEKDISRDLTREINLIKSQRQKQKLQFTNQIKSLESKINNLNKQNEYQKSQLYKLNHSINDQTKHLIGKINQLLGEKNLTNINPNIQQLVILKQLSQKLTRLSTKFDQQLRNQRKLLNKTFDSIVVEKFNKITLEKFINSSFKQEEISFFNQTVQKLTKQIIKNPNMKIPNILFYQKLILFLTSIDNKVHTILLNWKSQLIKAKQIIDKLNTEKQQLEVQKVKIQEQINNLKTTFDETKSQLDKQIKALNDKNKTLINQNEEMKANIKTLKQKLQRSIDEFNKKSYELNEKTLKFQKSQKEYKTQIDKQIKTINDLQVHKTQLKQTILQLQRNKFQLNKQIIEIQKKSNDLSIQLYREKQTNSSNSNLATQKIKQFQKQLKELKLIIKQKQIQIANKLTQIKQLQQKLLIVNHELKKLKQSNYQLNIINQQQQRQIQILSQKPKQIRCYTQYFNGNILNYQTIPQTEWFVNQIQKYVNKKILSTQFLYRCDPQNRNSLHNYIDGKPNLVIIIKHINGQIIGAFSQAPLSKGYNCDFMKGMLAGFKNKKVFHVKTQAIGRHNRVVSPRPVTWDENYIIFGNSDLRIIQATPKADNLQLYSNYGTSNGSYEDRNDKQSNIKDLFMDDIRTTKYLEYEAFSIIYEQ